MKLKKGDFVRNLIHVNGEPEGSFFKVLRVNSNKTIELKNYNDYFHIKKSDIFTDGMFVDFEMLDNCFEKIPKEFMFHFYYSHKLFTQLRICDYKISELLKIGILEENDKSNIIFFQEESKKVRDDFENNVFDFEIK